MTDSISDAIIIGAGHNGLTCATYLAQAGLKVVVLEKNPVVGGAAVTEEFHPGFSNSVASYTVSLLNPKVIRDLELHRHGLEIIERPAANFWPIDATNSLLFPNDEAARCREIEKFSAADAARLPAYNAALEKAATVLRELLFRTPPNAGGGLSEIFRNISLGRRLYGLDIETQRLLVDLFTKSAADFLDLWFESDIVKAAFAFDGIVGAYAAPSTPGTAYVLLHHCFGEVNGKSGVWGHAVGGMGAITQAMAKAAAEAGVTIHTDTPVDRIIPADSGFAVVAENGRSYLSRLIASNAAPKILFRELLPPDATPAPARERFLAIRSGSGTFRMNVALSELPDFSCRPGREPQDHHGAGIIIGPSLEYLENAYMDARREGWSNRPVIEMLIPSVIDDTLAPGGQHVASLFVQHVAPHLPHGRSWTDESEKAAFADIVIETVTAHAPNFRDSIIGSQILSPHDLEQRFGLADGDIFHGQLGLDQLFSTRPVLGHADYRMPVKGLYLCGAGAHPGGGVTGVPGHNCAREILKDLRTGRVG
jgi:phytoene dehydrogenase-like protein